MKFNWFFAASVALNVLFAVLFFRGCNDTCVDSIVEIVTHDTVYPPDVLKPIKVTIPEAYTAVPKNKFIATHTSASNSSVFRVTGVSPAHGASPVFSPSPCDSVYMASDTIFEENNFRAVILDTLMNNKVFGRGFLFANLKPEITTTIEKTITLKEKVKVYVGLFAGVQGSYTKKEITNWSAGPELMVTMPVGAAIGYSYDAKNNGHLLHAQFKIKLKK